MFDLLNQQYCSGEMVLQVDQDVPHCHSWQWLLIAWHLPFDIHQSLLVPRKPWEDISMDFVLGLLECEGFDAIMFVHNRLSITQYFILCNIAMDTCGWPALLIYEILHIHGLPVTFIRSLRTSVWLSILTTIVSLFGHWTNDVNCSLLSTWQIHRMDEWHYRIAPMDICQQSTGCV